MVVSYIHAVRSRDGDNDEGSISPLIVGMCALVLLIASVTWGQAEIGSATSSASRETP